VLLAGDHRGFAHLINAPDLANGLLIQPVADVLVALGAAEASADKSTSSPLPSALPAADGPPSR
jgi:hypothetical protein